MRQGLSIARNKGIALAGCDWINFLDSDDVMDPGYLAVAHRIETDADIVLFQYRFLDEGDGVSLGENDPLEVRNVDPNLLKRAVKACEGTGALKSVIRSELSWRYVKAMLHLSEFSGTKEAWRAEKEKLYNDLVAHGVIKFNEWEPLTEKMIDYEDME